ncbi:unnamed protein product, partial [Closterium sp. NIES-64]
PTTAPCDVGMELNEGVSRVEEYPSVCCAYLCDANSMPCPTAAPPPSPRAAPRDSAIRHGHGAERGGGEGGGVPLPRRATAPYDMGMELSEVEARVEEYPSTLSYLRLHNTLLALDPLSRPVRFLDYFRFVTSSVFVPYTAPSVRAGRRDVAAAARLALPLPPLPPPPAPLPPPLRTASRRPLCCLLLVGQWAAASWRHTGAAADEGGWGEAGMPCMQLTCKCMQLTCKYMQLTCKCMQLTCKCMQLTCKCMQLTCKCMQLTCKCMQLTCKCMQLTCKCMQLTCKCMQLTCKCMQLTCKCMQLTCKCMQLTCKCMQLTCKCMQLTCKCMQLTCKCMQLTCKCMQLTCKCMQLTCKCMQLTCKCMQLTCKCMQLTCKCMQLTCKCMQLTCKCMQLTCKCMQLTCKCMQLTCKCMQLTCKCMQLTCKCAPVCVALTFTCTVRVPAPVNHRPTPSSPPHAIRPSPSHSSSSCPSQAPYSPLSRLRFPLPPLSYPHNPLNFQPTVPPFPFPSLHPYRIIIAIISAGPDALLEERALRCTLPQALPFALKHTVAAMLESLVKPLKDFLSAGPALRNIIAIITAGPDALLEERALRPQALSFALEDTVAACLRLLLLALSLDQSLADTWQPAVRPLHLVLADDVVLVTAVMSFVRYQPSDAIQRSAIELTSVFSARGVPLVAMALEVGMVQRLVEDFAECLDVSASTVSVQGVAAHGDASGATVDGGGEEEEGGEEGEETDCATLILQADNPFRAFHPVAVSSVQCAYCAHLPLVSPPSRLTSLSSHLPLVSPPSHLTSLSSQRPCSAQLLLASLGRQRPTLAHMLLGFDVDRPLAASLLQPNRRFSALRILLDLVLSTGADADSDQSDATAPPRVSLRLARLREMSVRVLYHLAADPATSAPTAVLLQAKPLSFFAPLLSSALSAPLPRRSSSPGHRVAALHERAWLLKLLALALHTTPPAPHAHKHHHSHHAAHSATAGRQLEICRQILSALFMADGGVGRAEEVGEGGNGALVVWGGGEQQAEGVRGGVLAATQLLELFLFALPDVTPSFLPHIAAVHHQLQLEELLGTAAGVAEGGVFEVNERGDRLVDLRALSHILTHRFALLEAQRGPGAPFLPGPNLGVAGSAAGSAEVRQEAVREALRFVWRRNRVEEEAAAQQHVALAWAQLLQMALSRRFDLLPPHARLEALLQLLSACLRAIAAPHTPLTLAKPISQVVLVAFLQLQHLSSSSSPTSIDTPSSDDAGEVTWSDVIGHSSLSDTSSREGLGGGASGAGGGGPRRQVSVAESTGLLRDLLGALMRKDSSDSLRRRLYTSLLTFLAICARRFRSADVDISPAVMAVILKELPGEETSSDRSLDMLERQRREMQRATHALLSPHLPTLIRTLSHDASSSPSPLTRSLALAALSSLLSHSADPIAASASLAPTNGIAAAGRDHRSIFAQSVGGGQNQNLPIGFGRLPDLAPGMTSALAVASTSAAAVLSQMQAHGMVQACIADVSKGISEVLLLPSADAQRQAFVTEARLALLLAMAAATGRQGLLLLLNAGFLRAMAACPSLDAPVSEASYLAPPPVGLSSLDVPSESLCFAHLVAPVLRLLLALSTLAPPDASLSPHAPPSDATSKADVASQLVQFAIHHEPMLSRLLEDRSPACNPTDLLLLSLSTAFLSRALLWAGPSQLEGLRGLMLRAAAAYSVGDGESRVKYVRQRVAREEDDRAGEIGGISLSLLLPPEEQAMEEGVLRVRANLMAYLRSLVAFKRLLLPAASKHQHQGPTLSLLSDLLRQMVIDLQAAVEARGTALTKLADVNDMSRHEAEELIHATAFHAPHSAAHSHLPLRQARRQALLILAGLASSKERALSWMLFICEHLLHLLLAHFSLHHSLLSRSSSPLASSLSPSPTTFSSRPRSLRVQGPRVSPSPGGADAMGFGGVADGGEDAGAAAEAAAAGMAGGHSREEFESVVGTTADLEAVAREVLPSVNRLVEVNEDRVGCSTDYMKRLALSLRSSLLRQFHL